MSSTGVKGSDQLSGFLPPPQSLTEYERRLLTKYKELSSAHEKPGGSTPGRAPLASRQQAGSPQPPSSPKRQSAATPAAATVPAVARRRAVSKPDKPAPGVGTAAESSPAATPAGPPAAAAAAAEQPPSQPEVQLADSKKRAAISELLKKQLAKKAAAAAATAAAAAPGSDVPPAPDAAATAAGPPPPAQQQHLTATLGSKASASGGLPSSSSTAPAATKPRGSLHTAPGAKPPSLPVAQAPVRSAIAGSSRAAASQRTPVQAPPATRERHPAPSPMEVDADTSAPGGSQPAAAEVEDYAVDYDAVDSPDYDVDYDAVESPPYEPGVSGASPCASPAAAAAVDPLHTPPRSHHRPESAHSRERYPQRPLADVAGSGGRRRDRSGAATDSDDGYGSRGVRRIRGRSRSTERRRSRHRERGGGGGGGRRPSPTYDPMVPRSRSSSKGPRGRPGSSARSPSAPQQRPSSRLGRGSSYSRSPAPRQQRPWSRHSRSRSSSRSPPARQRQSPGRRPGRSRSNSRSRSRPGSRRHRSPDRRSRGYSPSPGRYSRSRSRSPLPGGDSPGAGEEQERARQRRRRQQPPQAPGRTLFVGDLPEQGFTSSDLQGLFEGLGYTVTHARVMGVQCYGFVEFSSAEEAEDALAVAQGDQTSWLLQRRIRVDWAKGSMPNWQQGKAVVRPYDRTAGVAGLEGYEHPTARMHRIEQAAAMTALMQQALAHQAAQWGGSTAAGEAGGTAPDGSTGAPRAGRQLVTYDDF